MEAKEKKMTPLFRSICQNEKFTDKGTVELFSFGLLANFEIHRNREANVVICNK